MPISFKDFATVRFFSGAAARFQDARFIFSHAGGTMPFLAARFMQQATNDVARARGGPDVLGDLKRFFYDIAQSCRPAPIAALRQVAKASQIRSGTDFPWGKAAEHGDRLLACGFSDAERNAILRDNAVDLLARLAKGKAGAASF